MAPDELDHEWEKSWSDLPPEVRAAIISRAKSDLWWAETLRRASWMRRASAWSITVAAAFTLITDLGPQIVSFLTRKFGQ